MIQYSGIMNIGESIIMIPYLQITPSKSIYDLSYFYLSVNIQIGTQIHTYIFMFCLFSKDLSKFIQILEFFLTAELWYLWGVRAHSYFSVECEKIDNTGK